MSHYPLFGSGARRNDVPLSEQNFSLSAERYFVPLNKSYHSALRHHQFMLDTVNEMEVAMTMSQIIQLLRERVNASTDDPSSQTSAKPPVSVTKIQEIEAELDCKLPDLLRNMYLELGNGQFSQQFELLSIREFFVVRVRKNRKYFEAIGDDAVGFTYLVIRNWGCSVYSCIDHSHPPHPVLRYDAVGGLFIPEKRQPAKRWGQYLHLGSA